MLGELKQDQIDRILHAQSIGRIGCHIEGKTYIVPVTYVYDNGNVYGHSTDGMKLHMMRVNPEICFQVDQIKNLADWQSVVAWGTFEELHGEESAEAMRLLTQRLTMLIASGRSLHELQSQSSVSSQNIIVYRIHLTEKTGRFEIMD